MIDISQLDKNMAVTCVLDPEVKAQLDFFDIVSTANSMVTGDLNLLSRLIRRGSK